MPQQYFCLLTKVGEAKDANAKALGTALKITQMAVGDGNGALPVPDPVRTALVREVRRAPLNSLNRDPVNLNQVIAEQVLPEDVGGWWIREIGLYDEDGDLVAIGNCAESYKPLLAQGSGRTQVVRMVLIMSSAATVELKVDPSIVLATRQYVQQQVEPKAAKGANNDITSLLGLTTALSLAQGGTGVKTLSGLAFGNGTKPFTKATPGQIAEALEKESIGGNAAGLDVYAGNQIMAANGFAGGELWLNYRGATGAITQVNVGNGMAKSDLAAINAANIDAAGNVSGKSKGVTGTVDVANGGTGAQNANDALVKLGAAPLSSVGFLAGFDADFTGIARNIVLPATVIGKALALGGVGATQRVVTLPAATGQPDGATIHLYNQNPSDGTGAPYLLTAAGGESIVITTAYGATSVLAPGDMITLAARAGLWVMVSGATGVSLERMLAFGSAKTAHGWQRLPGGLILQWGQFVQNDTGAPVSFGYTLPIAFPTACLQAFLVAGSSIAGGAINNSVEALNVSYIGGFTSAPANNRIYRAFAIGY